eukprot:UN34813
MGLTWFDFVLVCSNKRIRELEVDIADRLHEKNVEFCVVRTQIDAEVDARLKTMKEDVDSDDSDEEPVSIDEVRKQVELDIRKDMFKQMSSIPKDKLKTYLVSQYLEKEPDSCTYDLEKLKLHISKKFKESEVVQEVIKKQNKDKKTKEKKRD